MLGCEGEWRILSSLLLEGLSLKEKADGPLSVSDS